MVRNNSFIIFNIANNIPIPIQSFTLLLGKFALHNKSNSYRRYNNISKSHNLFILKFRFKVQRVETMSEESNGLVVYVDRRQRQFDLQGTEFTNFKELLDFVTPEWQVSA